MATLNALCSKKQTSLIVYRWVCGLQYATASALSTYTHTHTHTRAHIYSLMYQACDLLTLRGIVGKE